MAGRWDGARRIQEALEAYGFPPGGTFRVEAAQREDQFVGTATAGRLRPMLTDWQIVYTEPGPNGRSFVCAAYGVEALARDIVDILAGRLTCPNGGGTYAAARIQLTWVGPFGGHYRDQDGHPWATFEVFGSGRPAEACGLCGRSIACGYRAAMTDISVCSGCVEHVELPRATAVVDDGDVVAPARRRRPTERGSTGGRLADHT